MKYPRYEYQTESELHFFEFTSVGIRGNVKKIVQYSRVSIDNIYNLAFGDYDETTDQINDQIVTNNGDSRKVLATVVSTVYAFTGRYPDRWIFATGSSEVRTRLYRMGITNNLSELKKDFLVYGMKRNETFEEYSIGQDYQGFLIRRKNKDISL
ncbi:DUF6934 family protein [Dyadobacter diqingensis]|uniref:DUF6934 family protein n=1 Tax=Dyadobacter diqingensis TaxID=2938121 RepID=UPI0020C1B436|nr:hypothetical protein [Dyadobacter diqingensis]